jgi:hypothetical protein
VTKVLFNTSFVERAAREKENMLELENNLVICMYVRERSEEGEGEGGEG